MTVIDFKELLRNLETRIFWKADLEARGLTELDRGIRYLDRQEDYIAIYVNRPELRKDQYVFERLYRRVK